MALLLFCLPRLSILEGNFQMDDLNIKRLEPDSEHPYVRYYLDVRVRVGGRPCRIRETMRGSQAQAKTRYLELQAHLRNGSREVVAPPGTFGELLERYKQNRGGEIPRKQRPTFDTLVRDLGRVDLRALPGALDDYAVILRTTVSQRGKRLSNASINRLRSMARAALNLAVELRDLEENPLLRSTWKALKEPPRDRILTDLEVLHLLNVVDQEAPHLSPLVRFSLAMPARKGELVNARREWLDLMGGVIRVPGRAAKGGRGSVKPIPPDLVPYFRSLPSDCPWLFYRVENGQYKPLGDFKRSWRRCLALAGLPDFRFHDLRHCATTSLVASGSNLAAVQIAAGWSDLKMVTRYNSAAGQNVREGIRFPAGKNPLGYSPGTLREEKAGKVANL
jgi:integrase